MEDQKDLQEKTQRLVEVDGNQMSEKDLADRQKSLPNNERLAEVEPGKFRTLKRMQE
jgi:hypothetical protein